MRSLGAGWSSSLATQVVAEGDLLQPQQSLLVSGSLPPSLRGLQGSPLALFGGPSALPSSCHFRLEPESTYVELTLGQQACPSVGGGREAWACLSKVES